MKHLRLFKTEAEYSSATLDLPNVSYIEETKGVSYEPYIPMNIITYYATDKLVETTSTNNTTGLHVNAFNSPMVSHEFVDGVGTITFEEDVTSIGKHAFYDCKGLTSVVIPDSVTSIGYGTFAYCKGLTSVVIPDSVTSIGPSAFCYCTGLTSVVIPDSVTSIGDEAFKNCKNLTSIDIPDSVTSIGKYAFYDCSGLTSITSYAVTAPKIENSTFQNVKSGGVLYVPAGSTDSYSLWMSTGDYYLGKYNWTIQYI